MWFIFQIFVLFLYGACALDECPNTKIVKNFNLVEDYCFGRWYTVARYKVKDDADCVYYDVRPDGNRCTFTYNTVTGNKKVVYPGRLRQISTPENLASIVEITYLPGGIRYVTLDFIDFRNRAYAFIYDCTYNKTLNQNVVVAGITSTSIRLSKEAKAEVLNFIQDSNYFEAKDFVWTNYKQNKCDLKCQKRY